MRGNSKSVEKLLKLHEWLSKLHETLSWVQKVKTTLIIIQRWDMPFPHTSLTSLRFQRLRDIFLIFLVSKR